MSDCFIQNKDRYMSDISEKLSAMASALQFYADGEHYMLDEEANWDTCSGEPGNWIFDSDGAASIEDGSVAKIALEGVSLWQSIEDVPLNDGVSLLLLVDNIAIECLYLADDGGDWYYKHSESEGDRVGGKITHWLPLHTTPKVKT